MNNLLWVHTLKPNELGIRKGEKLGGGKSFRLPQLEEVMSLFPPLNEENNYTQRIALNFVQNGEIKETFENLEFTDARKNNPDRVEHKIYLNNMGEYIGLEGSDKVFQPYVTLGFYKNATNQICFEVLPKGSILENIKASKTDALIDVIQINPQEYNFKGGTHLCKPFLLLAGISGTGKTRFVRKQAESNGDLASSYCLTAVRPDWHEPSDLLGHVSRLSGNSEYVVTDVLKFIVKSWLEIEQSGITLTKNSATGSQAQQQQVKPYWLCLDEMNLAPVEQYFADYLSVLETREWLWNDQEFTYQCDPLLKPSVFTGIDQEKLQKELGLESHDGLWQYFLKNGISIPFNLIVAGTVNMDETTHGFSRKVIDRALTFDFGEFFPNDFTKFFEPTNTPEILGYPVLTDGRDKAALSDTFDKGGSLSIALLESINLVLTNTPFKLAYRALNELLLSVICHKPQTEIELAAVWDDFLMCKVLPRIEGDIDKLTKGGEDKNILEQLDTLLSDKLKTIWDGKVRPDLFRKSLENDQPIEIECRAKAKLDWMRAQLVNGFTSFWP